MKSKLFIVLLPFFSYISCKPLNRTISKSENMVTANITLKSESGASIFDKDAMVTSETIEQYKPSKSTIQKAKKALKSADFEVSTNGLGLFVSTNLENFEKVLNVKLMETKSQNQTTFKADKKIVVPEQWKSIIESIDLSEPVEYFK
jgi:hypothetical protein